MRVEVQTARGVETLEKVASIEVASGHLLVAGGERGLATVAIYAPGCWYSAVQVDEPPAEAESAE